MEAARPATTDDLATLVDAGPRVAHGARRDARRIAVVDTRSAHRATGGMVPHAVGTRRRAVVVGTIDGRGRSATARSRSRSLRDGTRLGVIGDLFVELGARVRSASARRSRTTLVAFCADGSVHRHRRAWRSPAIATRRTSSNAAGFTARVADHAQACSDVRWSDRYPRRMTATDLTADDVLWDLATLLPAPGDDGLNALLERAEAVADELSDHRGTRRRRSTSSSWRRSCSELARGLRADRAGRAATSGSTSRPTRPIPRAARGCSASRSGARRSSTKLLFFELEWAELPDDKVDELLADERLAFAGHHLRSIAALPARTC